MMVFNVPIEHWIRGISKYRHKKGVRATLVDFYVIV